MKKMFFIFIVFYFLFFSCKTQQVILSPFVSIYKSDWVGLVKPAYIILKAQPKIFEMYAPGIYCSTIGEWNIVNDTLYIFPKYEYYADNGMNMYEISPMDISITTIPQQYLVKKDCLIDITDYSIVFPEELYGNLFNLNNAKTVYRKVNN